MSTEHWLFPPSSVCQCAVVCRLQVEGHVQPGETAVLRRAGEAEQAASGALPGLQVQTPAQTDLHCGGTEAEGRRVQGHDEEPPAGAESDLHTQVDTRGPLWDNAEVCPWQTTRQVAALTRVGPAHPHACSSHSVFLFVRTQTKVEYWAELFCGLSSAVNSIPHHCSLKLLQLVKLREFEWAVNSGWVWVFFCFTAFLCLTYTHHVFSLFDCFEKWNVKVLMSEYKFKDARLVLTFHFWSLYSNASF